MRALVVGGSGMIGANLVRKLLAEDCTVTVAARRARHAPRLAELAHLRTVEIDCRDGVAIDAVVKDTQPDVLFHLVSSSFNPPTTTAQDHLTINALGTLNVLEAARHHAVGRVILTGSAAEYGSGDDIGERHDTRPATIYGATKLCGSVLGQAYARTYGLPVVNLRLFTPFGPWERPSRLIPSTILSALAGEPVKIGSGKPERDFLFVADVVDALMAASTAPLEPCTIFNIASGRGTTVMEAVQTILELMQVRVPIECAEPQRSDEILRMSGNADAARNALGWQPRHDFRSGLEKTIEWFSANTGLAPLLA